MMRFNINLISWIMLRIPVVNMNFYLPSMSLWVILKFKKRLEIIGESLKTILYLILRKEKQVGKKKQKK